MHHFCLMIALARLRTRDLLFLFFIFSLTNSALDHLATAPPLNSCSFFYFCFLFELPSSSMSFSFFVWVASFPARFVDLMSSFLDFLANSFSINFRFWSWLIGLDSSSFNVFKFSTALFGFLELFLARLMIWLLVKFPLVIVTVSFPDLFDRFLRWVFLDRSLLGGIK